MIVKILLALGILTLASEVTANWSYAQQGADWPFQFEECGGETQTPIDIRATEAVAFKNPHPLKFSLNFHKKVKKAVLDNNGYGFKIEFPDKDRFMWSTALPGSPYTLLQVHIHFGSKEGYGSEHTLNGVHYPAEIHFVFQSKVLEGSEMGHLAVLGFLVDVNDELAAKKGALKIWMDKLEHVPNEGDKVELFDMLDVSTIIPLKDANKIDRYYRYEGSLTTPPCSEIVQWTVFQDPLYISKQQYNKLLQGKRNSGEPILKTFRPPMPLNGRTLYKSH